MARELLERSAAMATLAQALRSAADGRGRVVLLTGEAGIGKSTVLRAFRRSIPRGVRVLTGGCDDLLTPRALGPLRDAVVDDPRLTAILTGAGRDELFGALHNELTGPQVTALLIEDLHWADDATLDVLGYLARRADQLRLALVLTMRPDLLADHPLHRMVGSLLGEHVVRLTLDPLSSHAVARLAGPTRWDAGTVHQITGGNPFYVTETLAVEPGQAVPETIAQAVIARTRILSAASRAALQRLSVIPGAVEIDLAEAILGPQLATLDEAEQLGILELTPDGIRFRHELARRAVEADTPALSRLSAHRAVVAALLARPRRDVTRIVHHAIAAADADASARPPGRTGRRCNTSRRRCGTPTGWNRSSGRGYWTTTPGSCTTRTGSPRPCATAIAPLRSSPRWATRWRTARPSSGSPGTVTWPVTPTTRSPPPAPASRCSAGRIGPSPSHSHWSVWVPCSPSAGRPPRRVRCWTRRWRWPPAPDAPTWSGSA